MSTASRSTVSTRRVHSVILRRLSDLLLAIGVALLVIPFLIALLISLKPAAEGLSDPLGWPTSITLDNFVQAFNQMDYLHGLISSVVILAGTAIVTLLVGAMASYPISRIGRRWTQWTYRLFLLGTAVPIWVLLIPLYLFMREVGLLGSYIGVILIYSAGLIPVAVFFYSSFMRQVPTELEEAASIDGAGPLRVFFRIVFPLLGPVTATLLTYISLTVWNDLVIPLIFLGNSGSGTIMSNAYALVNPLVVQPATLFPAVILGVLPLLILFAFMQRYVLAGITSGAIK